MKRLLPLTLAAGLLLAPAHAAAQLYEGIPDAQEYLEFVQGSGVSSSYGVQVGPYLGYFEGDPGQPRFSIYCVDYWHYAKDTKVNVTQVGTDSDYTNTRLSSDATVYGKYRHAAYLASLFETLPEQDWAELHAAIWTITSGVTPGGDTGDFLTAAYAPPQGFTGSGWYVLTPDDKDSSSSGQEFLMRTASVPEPSTLLLMGSGLMLFYFARRRRLDILGEGS